MACEAEYFTLEGVEGLMEAAEGLADLPANDWLDAHEKMDEVCKEILSGNITEECQETFLEAQQALEAIEAISGLLKELEKYKQEAIADYIECLHKKG